MRRITAYEIVANPNDVIATHAGPDTDGKYRGCITRGEIRRYKMLISTEPIFDSPQAADEAMKNVIEDLTKWVKNELEQPNNPLVNTLEGEEGPIICQIVEMATARH